MAVARYIPAQCWGYPFSALHIYHSPLLHTHTHTQTQTQTVQLALFSPLPLHNDTMVLWVLVFPGYVTVWFLSHCAVCVVHWTKGALWQAKAEFCRLYSIFYRSRLKDLTPTANIENCGTWFFHQYKIRGYRQNRMCVVYDTFPCIWTAGTPVYWLQLCVICVCHSEGSGSITAHWTWDVWGDTATLP